MIRANVRVSVIPILSLALGACGTDTTPSTQNTTTAPSPTVAPASTPQNSTGETLSLDGRFEIAGLVPGDAWITLNFDPVALSMDNKATILVKGRGTPAIDAAAEALTAISVDTASPEGALVTEACDRGCTLDGVIVRDPVNDWVLKTLRAATPHAEAPPLEVGRDDPRRKPLLDALRPEIESDLGQKLIFEVAHLRERNGSAFAVVHPRTPAGKPVDFTKTRYAQRQADGVLDGDSVFALLQYRDDRWQVQEFVVGPTDVAWANWAQDYGAADDLFTMSE
jgi:hypothetical protein